MPVAPALTAATTDTPLHTDRSASFACVARERREVYHRGGSIIIIQALLVVAQRREVKSVTKG